MLTKDQIRKNLQNDPYWEPDEDASQEVWEMFDAVYQEMEDNGELEMDDDFEDDDFDDDDWE